MLEEDLLEVVSESIAFPDTLPQHCEVVCTSLLQIGQTKDLPAYLIVYEFIRGDKKGTSTGVRGCCFVRMLKADMKFFVEWTMNLTP